MESSVTETTARVQHWQLANVVDTLKKHCAGQIINHSLPSLIIHGREEKKERAVSNQIHSEAEGPIIRIISNTRGPGKGFVVSSTINSCGVDSCEFVTYSASL